MTAAISTRGSVNMGKKGDKEVIHSGHFMVSDFEAEEQDDEENVLLEIPGDTYGVVGNTGQQDPQTQPPDTIMFVKKSKVETVGIDSSLTKLFNAMSIAYRHKITSPKWNRFKGLKLRWKDKIRLNNIIWRCWHMQFIRKKKMTVCQFALDVDIHNKPEAIVLEGKYWKRQLDAVTAEYKKWRIYYKNRITGSSTLDSDASSRCHSTSSSSSRDGKSLFDLEGVDLSRSGGGLPMSLEEGDFSDFMDFDDLLFNSILNPPQPFAFPNPREIARGTGNSDFIQPGLIQLQPNLDDIMDIVEPLQEMLAGRGLPPVPEEEDFLADVGEAPELPPHTTAPLQYTARLTTAQTYTHSPTTYTPTPTSTFSPTPTFTHTDSSTYTTQITDSTPHTFTPPPTSPHKSLQSHYHQEQIPSQSYHLPTHVHPSQKPPQIHPQPHTPPHIHPQPHTPPHIHPQPHTPPQIHQQPHTPPHIHQQPHTPPQIHPQPQRPQLQSQQLQHQSHTNTPLHQSHTVPQLQQQQQPRNFLRSHSQHELGQSSQTQPNFVIPKPLPRRRSHSSGGGSSNSSGTSGVAAPTLSPHQVISTIPVTLPVTTPAGTSLSITSLPVTSISVSSLPVASLVTTLPLSSASISTTLPHIAPAPPPPQASAAGTPSNFLAQLLNPGSYQVSSSIGSGNVAEPNEQQLAAIKSNLMTVASNIKVPVVLPHGVVTSPLNPSSSSSSSSSANVKPIVTATLVAPPITLSAVTPSSLKSQPFTQTIGTFSPCSPQGTLKQSPPHGEPSSPLMINIPSPPSKSYRGKTDGSNRQHYKEHRRVCHINAEQKRRSNLKNNFDMMEQLIPSINPNSNAKISKAVMLQKGAEYIQQLKSERQFLSEKADQLRADIESLSSDISITQAQLPVTGTPMTYSQDNSCLFPNSIAQSQLPATGAPMTHARYSKLREMFENYVRERTLSSWKFYIFSLITEPLLESFNCSVSTSSVDDLVRSSLAWLDQQCSLNVLRPLVSSSMRKLSTTTNVLGDPESLPEEVFRRVTKQEPERHYPR